MAVWILDVDLVRTIGASSARFVGYADALKIVLPGVDVIDHQRIVVASAV